MLQIYTTSSFQQMSIIYTISNEWLLQSSYLQLWTQKAAASNNMMDSDVSSFRSHKKWRWSTRSLSMVWVSALGSIQRFWHCWLGRKGKLSPNGLFFRVNGTRKSREQPSDQVSPGKQPLTRNVAQCPTWWPPCQIYAAPSVQRCKVWLTPNTSLPRRETRWK